MMLTFPEIENKPFYFKFNMYNDEKLIDLKNRSKEWNLIYNKQIDYDDGLGFPIDVY